MHILLIDNYDSFTYNLVHDLERLDYVRVTVLRNDVLQEVQWSDYDAVVISPGPGLPSESGGTMNALAELDKTSVPVLGICLGLQAMVEHSGGSIYNLKEVRHGVPVNVRRAHRSEVLTGIPESFEVGLYHSWAARRESLSQDWIINLLSDEEVVMGIEHRTLPWKAFQFHPESILTPNGRSILHRWVELYS